MDTQDAQNNTLSYTGFWKRFAAFIIDWFITLVGGFIIGFIFGFVYGFSTGTAEGVEFFSGVLGFLASWIYYAAMESSQKQATIGKMALGIKVTDLNGDRISFGKASGRFFGKIISGLILGIGFLMIAFTSKKQGLHDIMAGCLVVNKNS
ncbi:RDD family protein [Patescibacteria group bacterium]|nr:RDD family protein [Patescibacteria group bacterium]